MKDVRYLRMLIRRANMTQQEVAEAIGVTERTVRAWLKKGNTPTIRTIRQIEYITKQKGA